MKAGYIQYDVRRCPEENFSLIDRRLATMDCELVVLPELCTCGYLFDSREELRVVCEPVPDGKTVRRLMEISRRHQVILIAGVPELEGDSLYNTAVVLDCGRYVGKYRKQHLSELEKKLFQPGENDGIFQVRGLRLGVQICFDLWFPEVARTQFYQKADLFCVLANFGGETSWQISRIRAIENLTPLVLCNRVGTEQNESITAGFLGKSTVFGEDGASLCEAHRGTEETGTAEFLLHLPKSNPICRDFYAEAARHGGFSG